MLMLQSLAALAVVLALFAFMVWGMRKLQGQSFAAFKKGGDIQVLQRFSLDQKHSLVEVVYSGKCLLIGLSPEGMQVLHQQAAPLPEVGCELPDEEVTHASS